MLRGDRDNLLVAAFGIWTKIVTAGWAGSHCISASAVRPASTATGGGCSKATSQVADVCPRRSANASTPRGATDRTGHGMAHRFQLHHSPIPLVANHRHLPGGGIGT